MMSRQQIKEVIRQVTSKPYIAEYDEDELIEQVENLHMNNNEAGPSGITEEEKRQEYRRRQRELLEKWRNDPNRLNWGNNNAHPPRPPPDEEEEEELEPFRRRRQNFTNIVIESDESEDPDYRDIDNYHESEEDSDPYIFGQPTDRENILSEEDEFNPFYNEEYDNPFYKPSWINSDKIDINNPFGLSGLKFDHLAEEDLYWNERMRDFNYKGIDMPVMPGYRKQPVRRRTAPRNRQNRHDYNRHNAPRDFALTDSKSRQDNLMLDLDCVARRDREIEGWGKRMKLLIASNPTQLDTTDKVRAYIEYHMRGNVRNWWNTSPYTQPYTTIWIKQEGSDTHIQQNVPNADYKMTGIDSTDTQGYMDRVISLLYNEFCGTNEMYQGPALRLEQESKAEYMLNNTQLCDMCDFKNFCCYWEKYFYQLSRNKQPMYAEMFYKKLPPRWAKKAEEEFAKKPTMITDGLAGRIKIVELLIEQECKMQEEKREFSNRKDQVCCDPNLYQIPIRWGCTNSRRQSTRRKRQPIRRRKRRTVPTEKSPRRRYRKRRQYRKKRPYRKRKTIYKPRKRQYKKRRKKYTPKDKGKRKCRCHICQEEGHYANECPNRYKNRENREAAKKMEEVYRLYSLVPVEETESDDESIYSIESDYTIRSFSSDPGSEWEEI